MSQCGTRSQSKSRQAQLTSSSNWLHLDKKTHCYLGANFELVMIGKECTIFVLNLSSTSVMEEGARKLPPFYFADENILILLLWAVSYCILRQQAGRGSLIQISMTRRNGSGLHTALPLMGP